MRSRSPLSAQVVTLIAMFAVLGTGASQAQAEDAFRPSLDLEDRGGMLEGSAVTEVGQIDFQVDYALTDYTAVSYVMNGKRITWSIDLQERGVLTLDGRSVESRAIVPMEKQDAVAFKSLLHAFELHGPQLAKIEDPVNSTAVRHLVKTTELLSMYGVGLPLQGQKQIDIGRAITSLCNHVGSWRAAIWDANGTTKSKNFIVGGHGVCKGHCGGGCPSGDREYTQDCLNHDACVGEEGACAACPVGVCGDEWWAASDDYVSAPSC
ncbi:MAG: hypothetical protein AAGN66_04240 [Acidobacteriota bacterium]